MKKEIEYVVSYFTKNKKNMYVKTIGKARSGYIIICDAVKKDKSDDYITDGVYIMRGKSIEPFVVPLNVDVFDEALKNIVYTSK